MNGDAGDIVLREPNEVASEVDPYTLRMQNTIMAGPLLPKAARLVLEGKADRSKQGPSSTRICRSKDITLEKRIELLESLGYTL